MSRGCFRSWLEGCLTSISQIAIDTAVFPAGTSGAILGVLARQKLWQDGLDFGHGVGRKWTSPSVGRSQKLKEMSGAQTALAPTSLSTKVRLSESHLDA